MGEIGFLPGQRKTIFCTFSLFLASNKPKEDIPLGADLKNVCTLNCFGPF